MIKPKMSPLQIQVKKDLDFLVKEKGFKPSKLATLTGRSPSTISEILNEKRSFQIGVLNIISERIAKYIERSELIQEVEQYQVIYNTATRAIKGQENTKKRLKPTFDLLIGGSGLGKSDVNREFVNANTHSVFMVRLDRGLSWRELLEAIAYEMALLTEEGKGKDRAVKRLHSSKLLDMIASYIEKLDVDTKAGNFPVLIIDEAEMMPKATLLKIKNLFTATEGMLSIIICGINKTKDRLYKLAGMLPDGSLRDQNIQNEFTTFVRRVNIVQIPPISIGDLTIYCRKMGITNQKVVNIIFNTGLWWNYQIANDMIANDGAEAYNQITTEAQFRAMCSQFM